MMQVKYRCNSLPAVCGVNKIWQTLNGGIEVINDVVMIPNMYCAVCGRKCEVSVSVSEKDEKRF